MTDTKTQIEPGWETVATDTPIVTEDKTSAAVAPPVPGPKRISTWEALWGHVSEWFSNPIHVKSMVRLYSHMFHSDVPSKTRHSSLSSMDRAWIVAQDTWVRDQYEKGQLTLVEYSRWMHALNHFRGWGWHPLDKAPQGVHDALRHKHVNTWRHERTGLRDVAVPTSTVARCKKLGTEHSRKQVIADLGVVLNTVVDNMNNVESRIHATIIQAIQCRAQSCSGSSLYYIPLDPDQSLHDFWMEATRPLLASMDTTDLKPVDDQCLVCFQHVPEPLGHCSPPTTPTQKTNKWLMVIFVLWVCGAIVHTAWKTKKEVDVFQRNQLSIRTLAELMDKLDFRLLSVELQQHHMGHVPTDLASMSERVKRLEDKAAPTPKASPDYHRILDLAHEVEQIKDRLKNVMITYLDVLDYVDIAAALQT